MPRKLNTHNGPGISFSEELYTGRTEETLSESARIWRDAWCLEYIKDYNGPAALARMGWTGKKSTAATMTYTLIREPYVARKLDALCRQLKVEDVVTRQQVMGRMWEEANSDLNQGKVKVAALAHIANMLGMTKQKDETGNQTPIGVLLVPMHQGDDWSQIATQTQAVLKQQAAA